MPRAPRSVSPLPGYALMIAAAMAAYPGAGLTQAITTPRAISESETLDDLDIDAKGSVSVDKGVLLTVTGASRIPSGPIPGLLNGSGNLKVENGTLTIEGPTALSGNTEVGAGGTLVFQPIEIKKGTFTSPGLPNSAHITIRDTGTLTNDKSGLELRAVTLEAGGTLEVNESVFLQAGQKGSPAGSTLDGRITGAESLRLLGNADTITRANPEFTGQFIVGGSENPGAQVTLTATGAIGATTDDSAENVKIEDDATLIIEAQDAVAPARELRMDGGTTLQVSADQTLAGVSFMGPGAEVKLDEGKTFTLNTPTAGKAGAQRIAGTISGDGDFTHSGTGKLALGPSGEYGGTGQTTFTGTTRVNGGGELALQTENALGDSSRVIVNNGSTLTIEAAFKGSAPPTDDGSGDGGDDTGDDEPDPIILPPGGFQLFSTKTPLRQTSTREIEPKSESTTTQPPALDGAFNPHADLEIGFDDDSESRTELSGNQTVDSLKLGRNATVMLQNRDHFKVGNDNGDSIIRGDIFISRGDEYDPDSSEGNTDTELVFNGSGSKDRATTTIEGTGLSFDELIEIDGAKLQVNITDGIADAHEITVGPGSVLELNAANAISKGTIISIEPEATLRANADQTLSSSSTRSTLDVAGNVKEGIGNLHISKSATVTIEGYTTLSGSVTGGGDLLLRHPATFAADNSLSGTVTVDFDQGLIKAFTNPKFPPTVDVDSVGALKDADLIQVRNGILDVGANAQEISKKEGTVARGALPTAGRVVLAPRAPEPSGEKAPPEQTSAILKLSSNQSIGSLDAKAGSEIEIGGDLTLTITGQDGQESTIATDIVGDALVLDGTQTTRFQAAMQSLAQVEIKNGATLVAEAEDALSDIRTIVLDSNGALQVAADQTFDNDVSVAGNFRLNAEIDGTGSLIFNDGGTFAGTGRIAGGASIGSGATHAPGNSVGTQTVGTYTLADGATLEVELDTDNSGALINDLVRYTTSATLGDDDGDSDGPNVTVQSLADGLFIAGGERFAVIEGDGVSDLTVNDPDTVTVTGNLDLVSFSGLAGATGSDTEGAYQIQANRTAYSDIAEAELNAVQAATATALSDVAVATESGAGSATQSMLVSLDALGQAVLDGSAGAAADYQDALDQLSGARLLSADAAWFEGARRWSEGIDAVIDRGGDLSADHPVHVSVYADRASTDDIAARPGFDRNSRGFAVSVERAVSARGYLGAALGYESAKSDFDRNGGHSDQQNAHTAIRYAFAPRGDLRLSATAVAGISHLMTDRPITLDDSTAHSDPEAWQAGLLLNGEHRFAITPTRRLTAMAGVGYLYAYRDGFNESGDAALPLQSVSARAIDSLISRLGLAVSDRIEWGQSVLTPSVKLVWVHDFSADEEPLKAKLTAGESTDDPSSSIRLTDRDRDADRLRLNTGIGLALGEHTEVRIGYQAELGEQSTAHQARAGLTVRF